MIISRIQKPRFILILITLFIALCTTENNLAAAEINGSTLNDSQIINSINYVNNPALITGIDSASLTEDIDSNGMLVASGKLNITDNDAGEAALIQKTATADYGNFYILATGLWYYVANNNQAVIQNLASGATLTDSLIVNSVDGTPHSIVITIKGSDEANNPARITGIDSASLTKDANSNNNNNGMLVASGKLNITDKDAGEAALIAKTVTADYGNFYILATGLWYYVANNNQTMSQNLATGATLTDSLIVNSIDGTAHTLTVTILGINENNTPAGINLSWVAPAEREDNSALALSAIAGYKIYYGTKQGQYSDSVAINNGTAVAYTFTNLPADTYYFAVTTIDTEGRESEYSSVVMIII